MKNPILSYFENCYKWDNLLLGVIAASDLSVLVALMATRLPRGDRQCPDHGCGAFQISTALGTTHAFGRCHAQGRPGLNEFYPQSHVVMPQTPLFFAFSVGIVFRWTQSLGSHGDFFISTCRCVLESQSQKIE